MRRVLRLAGSVLLLAMVLVSYSRSTRSVSGPIIVQSSPVPPRPSLWARLTSRPRTSPLAPPPSAEPARPVTPLALQAGAGPRLWDVRSNEVEIREVPPGAPEGSSRGVLTDADGRRLEIHGPRVHEKVYRVTPLPSSQRFAPPAPTPQAVEREQRRLFRLGFFGSIAACALSFFGTRWFLRRPAA